MEHKRNAEKELSLNAAIPLSILDRELRPPRPADGMRKRVTKRPTSGSAGTRANSADPGSSPLGGGGAVTSDDGGSRAATRGYTPRDMRGPKDAATVEEYNAVLSFPPVDRAEILQTAGGSLSVMARTVPFQALGTSVLAATRFARRPHLNPALQAPEVSGGDTRGGGVAGKGGGRGGPRGGGGWRGRGGGGPRPRHFTHRSAGGTLARGVLARPAIWRPASTDE